MTLRIHTLTDKEGVTLVLSGRVDLEGSTELRKLIEQHTNGRPVTLDLCDIQLVDRSGIEMLAAYCKAGVQFQNCPAYISDWISRLVRNGQKPVKRRKKMNNVILATFNDDRSAIDAMHKMYELNRQGDIEVYNHILLKRKADGSFEYLKDERDPDGWGTIGGMLLGTTVGLIAGPVGALVGMFGGTAVGAITDAFRYSFDYDFMENFKHGLPAGTTTLIAEVTEPSPVFVNDAFAPFGAKIWRSNFYTEQDRYYQAQVDAFDAEIAEAERELKESVEEDKAEIQAKIANLRARRDAKVAEIKADIEDDVDSFKADIARLESKIQSKVDEVRKNRLEYKIAKNRERIDKYTAQAAKLEGELSKYQTATPA